MRRLAAAATLLLSLLLVSCAAPSSSPPPATRPPQGVTYAAIGASETYGIGADDRYRQAWPQVFFNDALPASSTLYNFGIPAATTRRRRRSTTSSLEPSRFIPASSRCG